MRKLTGDHNQCPSCSEYFNSTTAFDTHLIRPYPGRGVRICLTVPEMLTKGMSKNKGDWWIASVDKRAKFTAAIVQNTHATESQATTLHGKPI